MIDDHDVERGVGRFKLQPEFFLDCVKRFGGALGSPLPGMVIPGGWARTHSRHPAWVLARLHSAEDDVSKSKEH